MKNAATSLMTHMTPNPVSIDPEASLDSAVQRMVDHGFRHLPVVVCNQVVGILSDRDLRLATSLMPARRRLRDDRGRPVPGPRRVAEVMTTPVHCLPWDSDPATAARDMVRLQIGAIPVVEESGLLGIVTETNLLQAFVELCRLNRGACDDLVRYHMHRPLSSVVPHTSIEEAFGVMDHRVGHLAVVKGSELVGFLSQRDLLLGISRERIEDARAESAGELVEPTLPVSKVMTKDVYVTGPGESLCGCAKTMVGRHLSALPVVEDGVPVGVLTQRDVLEYYASLTHA